MASRFATNPRHSTMRSSTPMSGSYRDEGRAVVPDAREGLADDGPLATVLGERGGAARAEAIVLAGAPGGGGPPGRFDLPEPLETVQQGVQHPVAPLELPVRERVDALQDGVA